MNHRELVKLTITEEVAITWMKQNNYLKSTIICDLCGVLMQQFANKILLYRCSSCDKVRSLFYDTILANMKISICQFLDFTYFWVLDCIGNILRKESGSNSLHTSQYWSKKLREICWKTMLNFSRRKIGGIGHIVEIDESLFSKRKYHTGRGVRMLWVVGGIDLTTRECFFVEVINRNSVTLSNLIKENVIEGSEIWTDCWGGYINLNSLGYIHQTVNHSSNFVDPETGVNTQLIENTWWCLKRKLRSKGITNRSDLMLYFAEFLFKRKYGIESFDMILKNIYV